MTKVKIGTVLVGDKEHVFIIAEAGVNHNGSLDIAKKLIDAAKDAGADAIKFQAFKAEQVVTKYAEKADYQKKSGESASSQYDLLKKLELKDDEIKDLYLYAKIKNIIFLSSVFDKEHVDLLNALGVPAFKVPSGEITNFPLLRYVAEKKKPIILSTGMSTLNEIEEALAVITPKGVKYIILLHCITNYPAEATTINLRMIDVLKKKFDLPIGFSDHTIGITIPIAATALGAVLIEKHITLDKTMVGPDHRASLEPNEFKEMVQAIRTTEKALDEKVQRSLEEEIIKKFVRRSIVAKTLIPKGTVISEDMLEFKRPATGISPKYLSKVVGKKAKVDIEFDEMVTFEKLM